MKTPYNLSKDYEALYNLVCEGLEVACFVDYDWRDGSKPSRDLCRCVKHGEFEISVVIRGNQYGSVNPWDSKKGTEKELFIKECERMNLEWIMPNPEKAYLVKTIGGGHGEPSEEIIGLYAEKSDKLINDANKNWWSLTEFRIEYLY